MTTLRDNIVDAGFANRVFTDSDLVNLLGSSPAARYGLVNKALKQKELIQLKRGLYLLADKYRSHKVSKFFLANRMVPLSYISVESALSYHGWIPEAVYTVTSVLFQDRNKEFSTPFGDFAFHQIPVNDYEFLTGVIRVEETATMPFLLASPLRALADYIYIKKTDWQGLGYLTKGLRIEMEELLTIEPSDFIEVRKVYRSKRVLDFLDKLKKELMK